MLCLGRGEEDKVSVLALDISGWRLRRNPTSYSKIDNSKAKSEVISKDVFIVRY
jgi:hypothetical protein